MTAYNETIEEDEWLATSIEDKKLVIDIKTLEEYVFLDFDDNNGYAIVGNDYDFLDFSVSGDLSYTKSTDHLYWSQYDGFVYKENDEYLRCDAKYLTKEELNEYEFNYNGKAANKYNDGSDVISNIPDYLESRYGGDWYCDSKESNSLKDYIDVYQKDYAIYDNGEGNCTLSAFYGIV